MFNHVEEKSLLRYITKASGSVFAYTLIHFVSISAKFGIFTVVGLDRTLVEAKIAIFESPSSYFM